MTKQSFQNWATPNNDGSFTLELSEPTTPTILKEIKAGQTLTARSIGDWNCIFSVEIISRNKSFVNIKAQGQERRCKVYMSTDGVEYIYGLGRHSMAPIFKAI